MAYLKKHRRLYKAALALLALCTSLAVQLSPLWLSQADGTPITICSSFGSRTIIIDDNGKEIPSAPSIKNEHCSICLASSMDIVPADTLINIQHVQLVAIKAQPHYENDLTPNTIAQNHHGIRAPPTHA